MGTVISKGVTSFGAVVGSAFSAPIKAIFGSSCEGVCLDTWDLICFVEHLCITNILRLLMVAILAYITLLFFYLLFKVGILQCIGRSLCKMTWAACETYFTALEEISCFLWHKFKHTKRVYRHRLDELEEGFGRSDDDDDYDSSGDYATSTVKVIRRRRSVRERRKDGIRSSLYPTRHSSKRMYHRRSGSHHHVRLKTSEVSFRVKGSGKMHSSRRQSHLPHYTRRRR